MSSFTFNLTLSLTNFKAVPIAPPIPRFGERESIFFKSSVKFLFSLGPILISVSDVELNSITATCAAESEISSNRDTCPMNFLIVLNSVLPIDSEPSTINTTSRGFLHFTTRQVIHNHELGNKSQFTILQFNYKPELTSCWSEGLLLIENRGKLSDCFIINLLFDFFTQVLKGLVRSRERLFIFLKRVMNRTASELQRTLLAAHASNS